MLVALRPGVLAVLRSARFTGWIDAEDLAQENAAHRRRTRCAPEPSTTRKVFAFAAADRAQSRASTAARKMLRQQTVVVRS